jgi:hypothetical protein
LAAKTQHE